MINYKNYKFNKSNYNYDHIYNSIKKIFDFNENKYSLYIKDILRILFESEKKGIAFVDIENEIIDFELFEKGWPHLHLKALKESKLINSKNSPIIFKNNKLSWIKWYEKFEEIEKILLKKVKYYPNNSTLENKSDFNKIKDLLENSDLIFIEGGPGTGKTTLVIQAILNLIIENSLLKIGIAAPTGKATGRMKEAIEEQLFQNNQRIFIECQTMHSWIDNSRFKLEKLRFKLSELDLLVIDEMSMVGFDIFESTINHISNDCKIILVGDANQLPPINSYSIWNYFFEKSKNNIFEKITIKLKKIYRNSGDIINLSKSVVTNSSDLLKEQIKSIKSNKNSNVRIFSQPKYILPPDLINDIHANLNDLKYSVKKLSSKIYIFKKDINNLLDYEKELTNEIFNKLNNQIVLCKRNKGVWSVEDIHETILYKNKKIDFKDLNEGIPIMCTKNNNDIGLSNGDIGVLIGKSENRRFLFKIFDKHNQPLIRLINPSSIYNIVPAIAITIHKSQGSEAKKVCILWDNSLNTTKKSPIRSKNNNTFFENDFERRLFYTAITRAKNHLDLYY
tara:strand:- start:717 stop:2405 length:1689 start_codon:yes stop_codon:yes gene_type:complete